MSFGPTSFRPYTRQGWGAAAFRGLQGTPGGIGGQSGNVVYRSPGGNANWQIIGVTRNSSGAVLASCNLDLFITGSDQLAMRTVSDAGGNFTFPNPGTGPFYIVAYKAGSPDVAGTTVNTIFPTALVQSSTAPTATALPQPGNLVFQLSADSLAQSNGTAVSSWTDSINGAVATQATGGLQPVFRTNAMGGKPAVEFPGSAFMNAGRPTAAASALDTGGHTIFVVYKTLANTSNGMLFNTSPAGGGNIMLVSDGTNTGRYGKTAPHTSTGFSTMASMVSSTEAGAYRTAINGTIFYVDDVDGTTSGGQNIYIGGIQNSTFFVNAQIFEVLIWSNRLTAAELLKAQMWACDKYSQPYPWAASSDFIVFAGDSLTQGSGAFGTGSYPYQAAQLLSRPWGTWTNIGEGGITMTTVDTVCATHADPIPALIGKTTKVAAFEYYNQRALGSTACISNSRAFLANRKAVANMKTVFATSTGSSLDPDATRTAYNASFDGDSTNCDAYVPVHNNASIGVSGAYAANSGTLWFDTVHFNSSGYAVLAGLMASGISSI